MPERILVLDDKGTTTELQHLGPTEQVSLEVVDNPDEATDFIIVHVGATFVPVLTEERTVDEDADNTPGPMGTTLEMIPADKLVLDPEDVTVEQLKDILRDKDLPVSGTKEELIERLNADALEN